MLRFVFLDEVGVSISFRNTYSVRTVLNIGGGRLARGAGTRLPCSAHSQRVDTTVGEKEIAHLYGVTCFPGPVMNMPQTRDCLELAIDTEDSRTGYVLFMWYECAERKNLKNKKRGKKDLLVQPGTILPQIAHPGPRDEILMYNLFICGLPSFQH